MIYEMRHVHINKRAVNHFLDFSFLCKPIWRNATVLAFPHVLIVGGGTAFLRQNIWGNSVPPQRSPRVPLHYTTDGMQVYRTFWSVTATSVHGDI